MRTLRNVLRLIGTLVLAALLVWLVDAARSEAAAGGQVEPQKIWLIAISAVLILAFWAPWRPVRIAAAVLLLIGPVLAGILGAFIAFGGPDSRGPESSGIFIGILAAVAIVCLPILVFLYSEAQLARAERESH